MSLNPEVDHISETWARGLGRKHGYRKAMTTRPRIPTLRVDAVHSRVFVYLVFMQIRHAALRKSGFKDSTLRIETTL